MNRLTFLDPKAMLVRLRDCWQVDGSSTQSLFCLLSLVEIKILLLLFTLDKFLFRKSYCKCIDGKSLFLCLFCETERK